MQERHRDGKQYFDELVRSAQKYMMPYLEQFHPIDKHTKILEIGCGAGGNLYPFVERGCTVMGFDLDANRVKEAKQYLNDSNNPKVSIFCDNVFNVKDVGLFDIILVRDVIEHIPNKTHFFDHIKDFLKPQGIIYFTFPPWYMPFGGHQQVAKSKILSHMPYYHILPKSIYKAILATWGESKDTIDELLSIKECRLTIEQFRRYARQNGYSILDEKLYFINPHYEVKFNLKPRILNKLLGKMPFLRNFYTTGCYYTLQLDIPSSPAN